MSTEQVGGRGGADELSELHLAIISVTDHAEWLISRVKATAPGGLDDEVSDAIDELEHSIGWIRRAWQARQVDPPADPHQGGDRE